MARRGLPKAIIKKYGISKKAWRVFRGRKKTTSGGSRRASNPRRRTTTMARRRSRGRRQFTLPLGVVIPFAASFVVGAKPGWGSFLDHALRGEWNRALNNLANGWLFWDMDAARMDPNGGSYMKMMVIGGAIHWLCSKLGINRWLGRARVPVIRL